MLTKTVLATLFATAALASPTSRNANSKRREVKSLQADVPEWTVEELVRTCNDEDTKCTWTFGINTNDDSDVVDCEYVVEGDPASETPGTTPQSCGPFSITSGYDSGDAEGNGFTVLSVVNYKIGKLIYAGYNDRLLKNGETVDPDLSWIVYDLP